MHESPDLCGKSSIDLVGHCHKPGLQDLIAGKRQGFGNGHPFKGDGIQAKAPLHSRQFPRREVLSQEMFPLEGLNIEALRKLRMFSRS